ncbi:hypothetical protein Mpsy_1465 [Methanolobus psychrophilus R15]|nr:hypothetical protein Mpsy_1465 [Methanolobus psychrophilus R15]
MKDVSDQIITVINKVIFSAKLGMTYYDYRKHGQFEFAAPAILFACLVFTLFWQIFHLSFAHLLGL